ncbi:MAG TPA: HNH endonuclease signature motif containing protein, partial [Polyangiaceae bacterium]|nr:HNH endonuclease signature motif containing protein [Polyangiaceae bacterium]
EGGSHSADNLVTLCSAHHRALHLGELRSAGDASDFRVLPGALGVPLDGGAPQPPTAPSCEVSTKVASGLCQLGFRPADVHAVIAELRQQSELSAATPQQWLREALRRLHPAPAGAR